jgi:two-component system, chemotaxis family, protein-glutamate methylesterase/glutaminase
MSRDIIVIGASAGGVPALKTLFGDFNPAAPVSVFVVLHVPSKAVSMLPDILSHQTLLSVSHAIDGEPILPGHVYIAPPDHHLIIEFGHMHLTKGPKENRSRPAINPTFRSAALAYGSRVIGVVMSGMLDDGTAGLWEIKRRGGIALVQSPGDAEWEQMPESAIANVHVDHQVTAAKMGALLLTLVSESPTQSITNVEPVMSERTHLTCPDCHGPIDRFQFGDLTEYRCRVGHAYSQHNMLAAHAEAEERVLWSAVEMLEEGADLDEELSKVKTSSNGGKAEVNGKKKLAKTIRDAIRQKD